MNKFHKIYIGVLNNKNIDKLEQIHTSTRTSVVLLSNINLFELSQKQLNYLREKNIAVIPTNDTIKQAGKHKKNPTYALFVDWLLMQPTEAKFLLDNDSILLVAHKNDEWHELYGGGQGYAVSCHPGDSLTNFYGHSVSIPGGSDKLILKEFDGFFLKNTE